MAHSKKKSKKKIKNEINLNDQSVQLDDVLLSALLNNETITRDRR